MAGGEIYLRPGEGSVAMTDAAHDAEDILQALLAEYPARRGCRATPRPSLATLAPTLSSGRPSSRLR